MTFNPERNSPQKLDIKRIQNGLSKNQMRKIDYECDLLRMDVQKLLYVAPHLFNEGITAANTAVIDVAEETEPDPVYSEDDYSAWGGL